MPIHIINKSTGAVATTGEYVGRGSPLGNPFPITALADRDAVCDAYERHFAQWTSRQHPSAMQELHRLREIYESQGTLTLMCFCAPKRCHAETVRAWIYDNSFNSEESF